MKKLGFLALSLASVFAVSAQQAVLKDAERAMKSGADVTEVVNIITPALTDPSTATLAQTWYIPGKAAFSQYDKLLGIKAFKPDDPQVDPVKMANMLITGYDYFTKALPLDSVADAKGKIKTKYSKDIVNTLAGHFSDYSAAGADLFNAKDFKGAYQAWGIFGDIVTNPTISKGISKLPNDTLIGEIYFNQALAAWQADDFVGSFDAFMNAKNKGYNKKQLYDYAMAVAQNIPDNEKLLMVAREALPLYGAEDNNYMAQIVNYYLQAKDFDNAFKVINDAIAKEPTNAQYYVIQGVLYENQDNKRAEAKAAYEKARTIDPKNSQAQFNYGRILCEEAYAASDGAPTSPKEYEEYYASNIRPLFVNAAEVLENAYTLDQEQNPEYPNSDILKYLENVYYNLNDEAKLNDVRKRMTY